MKNNKGITLIALIITIIVMLILAMVAINMALDGGVITKAGKARDESRKKQNEEELLLVAGDYDEKYIFKIDKEKAEKLGWIVDTNVIPTKYISPEPDRIEYKLVKTKLEPWSPEENIPPTPDNTSPDDIINDTTPPDDTTQNDSIDVSGKYVYGPYNEDYENYISYELIENSNQLILKYNDNGINTEYFTYSVSKDNNSNTIVTMNMGEYGSISFKFIPIYDANNNIINKVLISENRNTTVLLANGTTGLISWTYPTTTLYKYGNSSKTIIINNDGTMCFPSDCGDQKFYYYIDSTQLDVENRIYPKIYTGRGNFQIITELGDLAGTHVDDGECMYINNVNGPNDG